MLRALLRPIPRFGFITLFALMLLFVSAAGWLKFHLDLRREEEALLADLSNAGVEYSLVRHSGQIVEKQSRATSPAPEFWDPIVPYFSRIDRIILRSPTSRALHERAARLPYVRMVYGEWRPPVALGADAIAAKVGLDVPDLDAPWTPNSFAPLPFSEAMDDGGDVSCEKFLAAWPRRQAMPEKGTATIAETGAWGRDFLAWDERVQFNATDTGFFSIATRKSAQSFGCYASDHFREDTRLDDPELAKESFDRSKIRLIRFFPREALRLNLEKLELEEPFLAALRERRRVGVERVDETRIRFDLVLSVAYPAADCKDIYSISMIARSDLDWELEAWEIVASRDAGPNAPKTLSPLAVGASYRGKLRRERDWVVTDEWATDYLLGPMPPTVAGYPPNLAVSRTAGYAKYDLSPDLDLSHVTPEAFDAIPLPPRRELPWLPWHRATFALSLGLFAIVGVRRFWKKREPVASSNA